MKTIYQNLSYLESSKAKMFYKTLNNILSLLEMDKLKMTFRKINNFLLSFLPSFLNKETNDHVHVSSLIVNSPNDYHLSSHSYDGQLLQVKEIFQDVSPLQDDVHGHNYGYPYKDVQESKLKHNLEYLNFFRLSTLDDFLHPWGEQKNLLLADIYFYLHKYKNKISQYFYDNFSPGMFYYKLNKLYLPWQL